MVNHYQQLTKKLNTRKQKPRYKAKRERRELQQRTVKIEDYPDLEIEFSEAGDTVTISSINKVEVEKPVKLTWFEKLLLFIRRIFRKDK